MLLKMKILGARYRFLSVTGVIALIIHILFLAGVQGISESVGRGAMVYFWASFFTCQYILRKNYKLVEKEPMDAQS